MNTHSLPAGKTRTDQTPKHVIYKKLSRDKSVSLCPSFVGVYMEKRDFVDHCEFVDPVGDIIFDPSCFYGSCSLM
uniref:Uncharacterized protein n=1 Tax=Sinocyclocheilus grahami TaxID=75366 RepID=A0A672SUK8_SINGR